MASHLSGHDIVMIIDVLIHTYMPTYIHTYICTFQQTYLSASHVSLIVITITNMHVCIYREGAAREVFAG